MAIAISVAFLFDYYIHRHKVYSFELLNAK